MAKQKQNLKKKLDFIEPRINDEICGINEVRLVYTDEEGNQHNKVLPLSQAKQMSDVLNLDLIEVNGNIQPPLCRIESYDKWLYNQKKKVKENKPKTIELKEIQLTTNIGKNDLLVKAKKVKEFISNGDKVKVVLTMKKRELSRLEESKRCLYEFIMEVNDVATPESLPKDEGTRSIVILKQKR